MGEPAPLGLTMQAVSESLSRRLGRPCVPLGPAEREVWEAERAAQDQAKLRERRAEARRAQLVAALGNRFADRTLSEFRVEEANRAAYECAMGVADSWDAARRTYALGCALYGGTGNGKSHLAATICHRAIDNDAMPIFTTESALFARIRYGYRDDSEREDAEIKIAEAYAKADVLVLDDLGTEDFTAFAARMMYAILNARYETGRMLIATSNYSLPELNDKWVTPRDLRGNRRLDVDPKLARKVIGRIIEMTSQTWVENRGDDWRLRRRSA